jgi:hypothetical protein
MQSKFLFVFFLFSYFCLGQKVEVDYRVYISDDDTYNTALKKGLDAAKSEALVEAGVTEYLTEYTRLITTENNDNLQQVFNSDLLIHLGGAIKEWGYVKEPEKKFDAEKDSYYIEFEIWAKIKKYKSKPDPRFKAKISGLENSYRTKDKLDFTIYPYQNCYLTMFYISEYQASIVFPYNIKQQTLIYSNTPTSIDYLEAQADSEFDNGRLITIITKEFYPFEFSELDKEGFYTDTNVEDIFKWILSIEPNSRTEYYHQFIITQ